MAFQGDSIYWVEVEKVVPNPFQPRREFDESKLKELSESIRMYGVLQPLTVTRKEVQREDGTFYSEYELIAGERRLRASKLAGVAQVPVIIREGEQSEQEKLELAIIENLQREDLNAVDRAIAFKQLADQFNLSHAEVAKKVGRSREYVSNSIRLLGLPEHMQHSLKIGDMMEGHARTLLMLTDRPEEQEVVFKEILLKKLSVREVERIVRKIATDKVRKKNPGEFDAALIDLEKKFTETLGTRVQIQKTDFGGKLTIDYFSEEDLENILKRIKEEAEEGPQTQHEMVDRLAAATPLEPVVEPVEPEITPPAELVNTPVEHTHFARGGVPSVSMPQTPPMPVEEYVAPVTQHVESTVPAAAPELEPSVTSVTESEESVTPQAQTESVPQAAPIMSPVSPSWVPAAKVVPQPIVNNVPPVAQQSPVPDQALSPLEPSAPVSEGVPTASAQQPDTSPSVPPAPEKPAEDESGLYSIRNFTV